MAAPMMGMLQIRGLRQIMFLCQKCTISSSSLLSAGQWTKKSININKIYSPASVPYYETERESGFTGGWQTYSQMLQKRKSEANRFIVVVTDSASSAASFCDHLHKMGRVKSAVYHNNHVLIEFENQNSIKKLKDISFIPSAKRVWKTRLFHYQSPKKEGTFPVVIMDSKNTQQLSDLLSIQSISEQMKHLASSSQMTELGSRLRFFLCSAFEDFFVSMFIHCSLEPYGSSVNGFGMDGSDLDMMMTVFPSKVREKRAQFMMIDEKRERILSRHLLTKVTNTIRRTPACSKVQRILFARVPIVKFKTLNVNCDLSIQNRSGSLMSELMYVYSMFDPRVKPMVAVVKQWAHSNHLVSSGLTAQPTSFLWLMLVIFFLQTKSVIPTAQAVEDWIRKKSNPLLDEKSKKEMLPVINTENLETLLMEFFLFYSEFDFENKALSLMEGTSFDKPNQHALYIENPLPVGNENLAKNVSLRASRQVTDKMAEALCIMEKSSLRTQTFDWRLTELLDSSSKGPQFKVNDLYIPSEDMEVEDSSDLELSPLDLKSSGAVHQRPNTDDEMETKLREEKRDEHEGKIQGKELSFNVFKTR